MTSYWSQNKVQTPLAHEHFPSGSGPCLPLFYLICMLHSCRIQLWACSLMICPLRFPPSEILLCSLLCLANAYLIFKTWLKHHLLLEAFHDPSNPQTETGTHLSLSLIIPRDLWVQSLFLTSVFPVSSILPGSIQILTLFWFCYLMSSICSGVVLCQLS